MYYYENFGVRHMISNRSTNVPFYTCLATDMLPSPDDKHPPYSLHLFHLF